MSEDGFKGRVLVLGGRGMLGRAVATASRAANYQTWVSGTEFDISDYESMHRLEGAIHPHYVVNCAGLIPERMGGRALSEMARVNGVGPWVIREAFHNSTILHVSTDCVFSGVHQDERTILDRCDALDAYGRSKIMGECYECIVVRTSFVGLQHGLLRWFLDQPEGSVVNGWAQATWSGSTVYDVADSLIQMFTVKPGIYHLAAPTTTKYDLLVALRDAFKRDIDVERVEEPRIYRALRPNVHLARNIERLVEAYDREPIAV